MTDKSVEALIAAWREAERRWWSTKDGALSDGDLADSLEADSIVTDFIEDMRSNCSALADALERERERNARLVRAIKPFAQIADAYGPNCNPYAYASIEDCRAARKALEENDG